jgi:hypothetical protein
MLKDTEMKTPKTCKECFNTPYRYPRPYCHYEKAYHLKKSDEFFKKEFNMDLGIDVEMFVNDIKPLCMECLSTIDKRADKIRQDELIRDLTEAVISIKDDLDVLKNQKENDNFRPTPIYKQQKEVEAPVKQVVKKQETTYENKAPDIKVKLNEKEAVGGWKFFQRNIKKDNIKKYLEGFVEENPKYESEAEKILDGVRSDFMKIEMNKKGNFVIKYREMK